MAGIYGDVLAFFPELLRQYEVFTMQPKIGAGYGKRKTIRKITAYLSFYNKDDLKVEGDLRVSDEIGSLWVMEDGGTPLPKGLYIEQDGQVYVISSCNDYKYEGGFTEYRFKRLAGVTDVQKNDKIVDEVILNDYA